MANPQPVTGAVVAWALKDSNLRAGQTDTLLGLPIGTVSAWISGEREPNQKQIRALARLVQRPASFFFLPSPPKQSDIAPSFRTYAGSSREPTHEALDAIRTATRIQKTTVWLRDQAHLQPVSLPRVGLGSSVEDAAKVLRAWMNWSVKEQTGPESDAAVCKSFREHLENAGVLVMHVSLDSEVTRGFSLPSDSAPVIAINTKDPYRARLFSYAHELAHLATRTTSVCDVHEDDDRVEAFCNRVAAALLMPEKVFRAHAIEKLHGRRARSVDDVSLVRARFGVSLRAAAIRLEDLGLATAGLFNSINAVAEYRKKGGTYIEGNERTKPRVRVDEYGASFIRAVASGVERGSLGPTQAAGMLRVSEAEWAQAKQLAGVGDAAE